jgi:hypothetical protein
MSIPVAWIKVGSLCALTAVSVLLYLLWQPTRQAELHTLNLLRRISDRDWVAVEKMLAPDFCDSWGHDRAAVVDKAREAGSHFFALHVMAEDAPKVAVRGDEATVKLKVGVYGSGTAVAHAIMDSVRGETEPMVLIWRRSGAWPWLWELVSATHEELAEKYQL